jgi:hypothetical protein
MNQGQCFCGAVRYEVEGPFETMMSCHCSMCRKHHGAPFATYVSSPLSGFRWLSGADSLGKFESSPGNSRSFCRICGSVAPMLLQGMGLALCPAGNLDGDLGIKPQAHLFVGSKAPWYEIADSLPQHAQFPPEFSASGVPRPAVDVRPGVISGSCLCGEMAFEVEGRPERLMYCHCSRCRRSRSAAHGANMFFKPEQFRWLRGESHVASFKDPNARFYTAKFCDVCGSGAPNISARVAYVPAGMLDSDPGIEPFGHIFVGSKSSWFEISDRVAQYQEMPARPAA